MIKKRHNRLRRYSIIKTEILGWQIHKVRFSIIILKYSALNRAGTQSIRETGSSQQLSKQKPWRVKFMTTRTFRRKRFLYVVGGVQKSNRVA